jgi:hypothetical protein
MDVFDAEDQEFVTHLPLLSSNFNARWRALPSLRPGRSIVEAMTRS